MEPGSGGAADHHFGMATADDLERLADGDVGGGFPQGERIVRPAEIVVDRHMAGRHVRQILEQPEG